MVSNEIVERAVESFSKQPRFSGDNVGSSAFVKAVYDFIKEMEIQRLPYRSDSRQRDSWLREWWMKEPLWAGVIKTCTLLDANRPWTITGGRNQVLRYSHILSSANDGDGWRSFMTLQAESFRTADMCAITEIGRDGRDGPMRGLYSADPTCFRLTGDIEEPLEYSPAIGGKTTRWARNDFFHSVSMPSTDESFFGLGFCATSMAFELIMILYSVLMYDNEQLGSRMPKGLMLLQGLSQDQWAEALEARDSEMSAYYRGRYGGVMVLATMGVTPPDAKMVALSQLPAGFNRETFINQTMYGYALITGRDPAEYWPIQTGSIGRGFEPEIQHRKAAVKGGNEFLLSWQSGIQQEMPETALFEFEQASEQAVLTEAQIAQSWVDVVTGIRFPSPSVEEQISREQYLSFLVEKGVIPPEWSEATEEIEATDTEPEGSTRAIVRRFYREKALSSPDVRRAIERYPDEPIVRVRWSPLRGLRETTIWETGADALKRRSYPSAVARQDESEILFSDGDIIITEADVDSALAEGCRRLPPGENVEDDPGYCALVNADITSEEDRNVIKRLLGRIK